jgi:hypothetical protein
MSEERRIPRPGGYVRMASPAEAKLIAAVQEDARRARMAPAQAKIASGKQARIDRAAVLTATGMSAARVGVRMAVEDGRPSRPYLIRTVRKWLAAAKNQ